MYDPIGGSEYEFVELQNVSQTEVDLSWHRISGIDFLFRLQAKLGSGERILIDQRHRSRRLGQALSPAANLRKSITAPWPGAAKSWCSKIRLAAALVTLKYCDKVPWPRHAAAGEGHSRDHQSPGQPQRPRQLESQHRKGRHPGKVILKFSTIELSRRWLG